MRLFPYDLFDSFNRFPQIPKNHLQEKAIKNYRNNRGKFDVFQNGNIFRLLGYINLKWSKTSAYVVFDRNTEIFKF